MSVNPKLGIIAGNGRFPFLVLDAARAQGYEVVVAAIKEETFPEVQPRGATVHWLSHNCDNSYFFNFERSKMVRWRTVLRSRETCFISRTKQQLPRLRFAIR
jgi:LpxI N-terminal domain